MDNLNCCLADTKGKHVVFVTNGVMQTNTARPGLTPKIVQVKEFATLCEADVQITDIKGII